MSASIGEHKHLYQGARCNDKDYALTVTPVAVQNISFK